MDNRVKKLEKKFDNIFDDPPKTIHPKRLAQNSIGLKSGRCAAKSKHGPEVS